MSSSRPYLIRALYEWILDNASTPYILVNARADGVEVPLEHVKDGRIILNISPSAVQGLQMGNEALEFSGRFAGIPNHIFVPTSAVIGIYAKENGQGMFFEAETTPSPEPTKPTDIQAAPERKSGKGRPGRPSLRVVK
jgi:stringent starvation protein B